MSTTHLAAYNDVLNGELLPATPELIISNESSLWRRFKCGELFEFDCSQRHVKLEGIGFSDVDQMVHLLFCLKSFKRLSIIRVKFSTNPDSNSVRYHRGGIEHLCVDSRDRDIARPSLIRILQCLPSLTSIEFFNVVFPPVYTVSYSDDWDTLPLSHRAKPKALTISTVQPINFRATLTCIHDALNLQDLRVLQLKVNSSASRDDYNSCRQLFELSELLEGSENLRSLDIGFQLERYLDEYLTKPDKLGFLRVSIHSRDSCSQQLQWLCKSLHVSSRKEKDVRILLARRQSLKDFEDFYDDWFDVGTMTTARIEIPFPVQGEAIEVIKGYLARGSKKSRYLHDQDRLGWFSKFDIQVLVHS
ncbi:hypothetical protein ARMSODRAFT_1021346 [Armillaria solidipes]|uniref:Uncharacterized protein n=1 Tax=Armillaria solidipes TaxID=1076256 RepID=A0A2H3BPQ5_9AGAR|nr:hypothetical protein ARMSODRAFT_1021346 [Armillaria solidipes]